MLPAVTSTLSTVWVGKPCATTVTLYVPSGMSWKANAPSVVVTVLWSIPVALSVAFTCAFGTELPDGSVTVPLIAPRNVCAFAATPKVKIITNPRNNRLILPPPSRFSEQLTSTQSTPNCLRLRADFCRPPAPDQSDYSPKSRATRHLGALPFSTMKKEILQRANMAL